MAGRFAVAEGDAVAEAIAAAGQDAAGAADRLPDGGTPEGGPRRRRSPWRIATTVVTLCAR